MTDFDRRWRRLVQAARRAPDRPPLSSAVPLGRLLRIYQEPRMSPRPGWRGWAVPAVALALLNLVAMPLLKDALETAAGWAPSLRDVPRPPALPPPPVPPPRVSAPPSVGLPSLARYLPSPAELRESLP